MWAPREDWKIGTTAKTSELGFVGISIARDLLSRSLFGHLIAIHSLDRADPRGYLDS